MSGGNNGPYPPGPGGFGMSPPPYGAGGPGMCTSPPQSGNPGMRPRPPPVSAGQRPPTGSQGAMGSQPSHPQQGRPINSSAPELGGGGPGARMSSTGSQVASSGTGSGPKPSAYRPSSNATITPTSGAPANNSANRGMYWTSMGSQDPQSGPQQQQHRQQHAVPPTAIRAGTYKEENFYVGRSRVSDGSMQVGMAVPSKGGLLIAYDGKANVYRSFEILCGVPSRAKWVQAKGRFDPSQAKSNTLRPIVCGSEKSGEPVYAATTTHKDREYGGRASAKVKGMAYVSKGSEEKAKNYYVLCETIE
ncbi:hypothetical protein GGI11_006265 [Coemansia sp. RSA 2049]|nr:hypothetical protein GGI11_006265 [Coemansia sp. RSA 2049]